jgi:hypothetical protein
MIWSGADLTLADFVWGPATSEYIQLANLVWFLDLVWCSIGIGRGELES